jgi:uncharacterized protein
MSHDADMQRLGDRISQLGSVVVAFSGGVDSSVVAAVAARVLGARALAVTAVSPALAAGELDAARAVARVAGLAHETISTDELGRAGYRANSRFRCYHCKSELYERLELLARERGFAAVASGANADDAGDWRPGLRAAAEHGVVHPLLELGLGKEPVRAIARALNVPSADKPASPCLASRLPYGTPVSAAALERVDAAERAVRARGYRVLRVRHYGERARLEIGAPELARALDPHERVRLESAVLGAGYASVEIDERPFRSGSLNVVPAAAQHSP